MVPLRQLSVVDVGTYGIAVFFKNLDLPRLCTLEYAAERVQQFSFLPLLASSNRFQRLSLNVSHISSEAMTGCLRLLPDLRELRIRHDPIGQGLPLPPPYPLTDFWASITPTAQNPNVSCPKLRIVEFTLFKFTSDSELLQFIQARTGTRFADVARLAKVHAEFRRAMEFDIRPALKQAIGDGLDLSLRCQHSAPIIYSPFQENFPYTRGEMLSDSWVS
ncbi:hypothetical protein MVEN_02141900 [Mycena venus]|uniref:F-box domain-containing protein n=1 Tax=Mycena venus TaxID=2733690 RepID=A0A8H7CIC6_9AGAR|nr:hypothetical protein MVEN_02141900 [Mycena venus]